MCDNHCLVRAIATAGKSPVLAQVHKTDYDRTCLCTKQHSKSTIEDLQLEALVVVGKTELRRIAEQLHAVRDARDRNKLFIAGAHELDDACSPSITAGMPLP